MQGNANSSLQQFQGWRFAYPSISSAQSTRLDIHQTHHRPVVMIKDVDEVARNLNELMLLASHGEEIVITVQGKPLAKLVGTQPVLEVDPDRQLWAAELAAAADAALLVAAVSTPQSYCLR
jgi:prevent-host-death family protein